MNKLKHVNYIILHCSDSSFCSKDLLYQWHVLDNGWDDIGYHFLIQNGSLEKNQYSYALDGTIIPCRSLKNTGAHCRKRNSDSIGICLAGKTMFTIKQFKSLAYLVAGLRAAYGVPLDNIVGHNFFDKNKTCPNFSVNDFVDEYIGDKVIQPFSRFQRNNVF